MMNAMKIKQVIGVILFFTSFFLYPSEEKNPFHELPSVEKAEQLLDALEKKEIVAYSHTSIFAGKNSFGTEGKGVMVKYTKVAMKRKSKNGSCECCTIQ